MAVCSNCGAKLGFFNKQRKCIVCEKQVCTKCLTWNVIERTDVKYNWQDDKMKENWVCSKKCCYKFYLNYIQSISDETPLLITNENNIGIEIMEDVEHNGKGISFGYMKFNPRDAPNENIGYIPQVKPLYERIMKDLKNQKRKVKEDYMNI